jgi:3'-phosphoadenosine 5'-phosphosulfate sulfotransferase (PAPS reductase)/FAD synthetase
MVTALMAPAVKQATLDFTDSIEIPGPLRSPALVVLSLGGGQDSTAILYKIAYDPAFRAKYAPTRLLVIMAETGDEHRETVEHIVYLKTFCRQRNIEFVHLTPDMGFHGPTWQSLIQQYRLNSTCGSKIYPKVCTDRLKVKPIYSYIESYVEKTYGPLFTAGRKAGLVKFASVHGKIQVLIGIAKGEEKRIAKQDDEDIDTGAVWMRKAVHRVYPLIDLGWDRKSCQDYILSVGETVPVPSNCRRCPFLDMKELLLLYRTDRPAYDEWVELEANKLAKYVHLGSNNAGVWGKNKTLPMVLEEAQRLFGHLSTEELAYWRFSHGHLVCSKY